MDKPRVMPASGIVLLALTTVVGVVATGDRDIFLGLRWIVAGVLAGAAWLWISGLLLVAGSQGILPVWARGAALLLCPASAVAAIVSLFLVSETALRWPLAIPLLIPPLLVVYVVGLYHASWRAAFTATPLNAVVWGIILVLSIAVWPPLGQRNREKARVLAEHARMVAEQTAQQNERRKAENLVKLQSMSPDAHITEWYNLLEPTSGVRPQAIEALRKVPRRQAEIEEGLTYGIPVMMQLVPELDLNATPELCAAARTYLAKNAKVMRLGKREPYPYEAQTGIDGAVPGLRWLLAHGCDCGEQITALETVIRTYLDSPDRQKALAALAGLKQTH